MIAYFILFGTVFSHSWLECTLYEGNTETFEADKCLGRPRPLAGNRNVGAVFGQDIGMDFRPQAGGARCQGNAGAGTDANFPNGLVTYETGKTYTLAWPPKNHVAAECTNANIPDTFLRLYMTPYNAAAGDPDQDTFKQNQVQASFSDDPHVRNTIDFKGFMNCPRFCDDTDKSLCTGTFSLGDTVPEGTYTFQWYWAFNSEADLYATCWEARVVAGTPGSGGTGNVPTPTAIGTTTTTTTMQPPPPGCVECCDPSQIVAPGTGSMVSFGFLTKEESRWLDCPEGFEGQFKIFCLLEDVRLVDGFCNPDMDAFSVSDTKDQSGTVAGLSVALTIVILLFMAYVAVTQGWVELCNDDDNKSKGSDPWAVPNRGVDIEKGTLSKPRANSVVTTSNTELPILPEAPATWYYTGKNNEQKGPVSQTDLLKYIQSLGEQGAGEVMVWDGAVCQSWTVVRDVPSLKKQLELGSTV